MHRTRAALLLIVVCSALVGTILTPGGALASGEPVVMQWRPGVDGYGCVDHTRNGSYWGYSLCGGNIGGTWYRWEQEYSTDDGSGLSQAYQMFWWDGANWRLYAMMWNDGYNVEMAFYDVNGVYYRKIRLKFYPEPIFLGWIVLYDATGLPGSTWSDPLTRSIANGGALSVWYATYGNQLSLCAGGLRQYCP